MPMTYLDALAHLSSLKLSDLDPIIGHNQLHGVTGFNLSGTHPEDWLAQDRVIRQYPQLRWIKNFGIHPCWVHKLESFKRDFAQLQLAEGYDGIGEIGLDYYHAKDKDSRQLQQQAFEEQLQFAISTDKPVVLHMVRAHHDGQPLLKTYRHQNIRGMIHGFHANIHTAKFYLDLGLHISLGPHTLRANRKDLMKYIPNERLLLETDTPQDNKLETILDIAQELATIRTTSAENLLHQSCENLLRLYQI